MAAVNPYSGGNYTVWRDPKTGQPVYTGLGNAPRTQGRPTSPGVVGHVKAPPTSNPYQPRGGLLSVPGEGERWYEQNKSRWGQPTRASQYWNSISGDLMGGKVSPNATRGAWEYFSSQVQNPGQGVRNAWDVSQQFRNRGAGEDAAAAARKYFSAPGTGESWIGQNMSYFSAPGQAEKNYDHAREALARIDYGDRGIESTRRFVGDAQRGARYFDDVVRKFSQEETPVEGEQKFFSPLLREKSRSETIFDSGTGGLIDPYQRAQDKQQRRIRDEMAATGRFNSGTALSAENELASDIAAAEARDRIALARQADDAFLARTGASRDFADTAGRAALDRRRFGMESASTVDEGQRANARTMLDAFGAASSEALSKVDKETAAAGLAQSSGLARMQAGIGAAEKGQRLGMDRMGDYLTAGEKEQSMFEERLGRSATTGLAADNTWMQQLDKYFSGARDADRMEKEFDQYGTEKAKNWFDIALSVDSNDRERMNDEFRMAQDVQRLFEGRERGALSDISGVAGAQMNAYLSAMGAAERERFEAETEQLNAALASGKLTAEQHQSQMNQLLAMAKLFVDGRK